VPAECLLLFLGSLCTSDTTETFCLASHVLEALFGLSPVAEEVVVVEELGLDGLDELSEVSAEVLRDVRDSDDSGGLLVDELAETSLVLDDGEGDVLLAAEGREPDDELEGLNVAGDDDELGLALEDEVSDVVETRAEAGRALGDELLDDLLALGCSGLLVLDLLGLGDLLGSLNALLADNSSLKGLHLVHELEESNGSLLGEGVVEEIHRGRALQTLDEDLLLALKTDVVWPGNKVSKITTVGNGSANGPLTWLGSKDLLHAFSHGDLLLGLGCGLLASSLLTRLNNSNLPALCFLTLCHFY